MFLIKESIRRALEDVFHHYVQMGNLHDAIKLYTRGMREYCTAPNQIIQV
jgi:pentatricopeptide repeat protein